MLLDRRKLLTLLTAAAFSGRAVAHDMAGMAGATGVDTIAQPPPVTPFAPPRHAALDRLVDMIIPKTDTPGAREAGVTGFIELLYEHWMSLDEQRRSDAELSTVMAAFGGGGDPRAALYAGDRFKAPMLRKLTIYGYYTSEAGSSEELDLNLVPGSYDACAVISAADHAPSLYTWGIALDLRAGPTT